MIGLMFNVTGNSNSRCVLEIDVKFHYRQSFSLTFLD